MNKRILEILTEVSNGHNDPEAAQDEILSLFSVGHEFANAKKGDYLSCHKAQVGSKKYTVGKSYQVVKTEFDGWQKWTDVFVKDDKNTLSKICSNGNLCKFFTVVSCR